MISVVYFFMFLGGSSIFATQANEDYRSKRYILVDSLLDDLQKETWDSDENLCKDSTLSILDGVKNNTLWATWIWNAMQLPVGTFYGNMYHLGSFDQCLKSTWSMQPVLKTQYCLVDVKMAELNQNVGDVDSYGTTDAYIGSRNLGMTFNTLSLGVCLPSICKTKSIEKISRHFFKLSSLPIKEVSVDSRDCQVSSVVEERPLGYYVFWFIIFSLVSISVFVYFYGNFTDERNSTVSKLSQCFCLARNFGSLNTVSRGEVMSIHGLRSVMGNAIIIIHAFFIMQYVALINRMDAVKELSAMLFHLDLTVDTFFAISGLLHIRKLMASSSLRPFTTILQRYLRILLPIYVLMIMGTTYVFPYTGSGPLWPKLSRTIYGPCKSWWRNFLLYTNEVDGAYCSEISWYTHTDFHLTIMATIIFYIFRRNRSAGFIATAFMYLLSVIVPMVWIYWQRLPALLLYDLSESLNIGKNKVYATTYKPFYTRASSYIVGMAMGYFMFTFKPEFNRKVLSKTTSILTFSLGLGLILSCVLIGEKLYHKEFGALTSAFLPSIDRTIWAIGFCFIIASCEYGNLPLVNSVLSSKILVPFSKLSYCNYLIHTLFIYRNVHSVRTPFTFDVCSLVTHSLGYMVLTNLLSLLLWIFIEAPITNMINLAFNYTRQSKKCQTNEVIDNRDLKASEKIL